VATLAGYAAQANDGRLEVTLVWQATGTPEVGYTAFVHLQGSDGRIWAQSDAVPAGWTRPTTGWLPGEYVTDQHSLALPADLPPGAYRLLAGLYDARSGNRVPAEGPGAEADNRVTLGEMAWP
jgi:hypothetical protein